MANSAFEYMVWHFDKNKQKAKDLYTKKVNLQNGKLEVGQGQVKGSIRKKFIFLRDKRSKIRLV